MPTGTTGDKSYHLPARQAQQFGFSIDDWGYKGALAVTPVFDVGTGTPAAEALPAILVIQRVGLVRTPPTDPSGRTPAQYSYMVGVQNSTDLDVDFHLDWFGPVS